MGNDLLVLVYAVTLCLGLLWTLFLIFRKRRDKSNLFIAAFVFFYTLELVNHLLFETGISVAFPQYLLLPLNFYLLHYVLFWFYALNLTGRWEFQKYKWHLIPAALEFFAFLFFFLHDGEVKLEWFKSGAIFPYVKFYLFLHLVSALYYGTRTLKLFGLHKKLITEYFSSTKSRTLDWIRALTWFSMIHIFINNGYVLFSNYLPQVQFLEFLTVLNLIFILCFGLFGWRQLPVFKNEITANLEVEVEIPPQRDLVAETEEDYRRMIDFINQQKPYLQKDLILSELAHALNISDRYLRQLIKTHTEMHFNHFINKFRIEETKMLLRSNEFQHYTLLAIGQKAGFQAKSTFFTAFKYFEKMTPATFQKQVNPLV